MRLRIFIAMIVTGAVLLPASPASAHGQLAFSDPAHQSTVSQPRQRLALYFTERPAPNAFFSVTTPSGVRIDLGWSQGEPRQLAEPVRELNLRGGTWEPQLYHTGFPSIVDVSHWPEQGVHVITYRSLASDGDRVTGEIRFDYQGPLTAAPAGWQPPANQPDPALLGDGHTTSASTPPQATAPQPPAHSGSAWPYWLIAAGLLVTGAAVIAALRQSRSRSS